MKKKITKVVINPNKLRIIPTTEGYFDALSNQYIYNYKDHLGNVRLSYTDTNKDGVIQPRRFFVRECDGPWDPFNQPNCIDTWKPGEIVEVNNYYPFGLMHNYTTTTQNAYQYKYNGKELQETGMYDYGARFYMPDIGRWGVIDPMAEKYRRWSPYNYAVNNPIMFIDPDGRDVTFSGAAAISFGSFLIGQAKAYNAANAEKTDQISFFSETGDENDSSLSSWTKANIGNGFSFIQEEPNPIRKYLKNETNFNPWSGYQTTIQQYQLNHKNTILEFAKTIKEVSEAAEYADKISEWTGGITSLKGIIDFVKEGWKSVNPAKGILIIGGTAIGIQGEKASEFIDMYRNVQDNYLNLHLKNPANMRGVTINKTIMMGPQNYIWSQYSFYDIYSHKYLGGGTFN